MPTPKPGGKDGKRVSVSFGKLKVKAGSGTETRNFIIRVVKRVQEVLNLPLATKEEARGELIKGTQTKSRLKGCKGAKSVQVEHPTAKNKSGSPKILSFPVPSAANIDAIGEFLATKSKAERFRLGGSWYDVDSFK